MTAWWRSNVILSVQLWKVWKLFYFFLTNRCLSLIFIEGIDNLLKKQVYVSAFPLHEVLQWHYEKKWRDNLENYQIAGWIEIEVTSVKRAPIFEESLGQSDEIWKLPATWSHSVWVWDWKTRDSRFQFLFQGLLWGENRFLLLLVRFLHFYVSSCVHSRYHSCPVRNLVGSEWHPSVSTKMIVRYDFPFLRFFLMR